MKLSFKKLENNWTEYTLKNDHNIEISILDYGATITKLLVPNRKNELENIVLGYKDYRLYKNNPYYLGSIIGRSAGRITKGMITIDGVTYHLEKNDGENHLHGGNNGLHRKLFQAKPFVNEDAIGLHLSTSIKENQDNYPGNVDITVTYTLTNENELHIEYTGLTDKKTPLILTNHTYFNLSGNLKDTILNHYVQFSANQFLELDAALIPTGKLLHTKQTPFDFQNGRKIKEGFRDSKQNKIVGGYDHYFLFEGKPFLIVEEETSGRRLTMETNQPGMVFYTGNNLSNNINLQERKAAPYLGLCFETQTHPAALQHDFLPNVLLTPGETYDHWTKFTFETI